MDINQGDLVEVTTAGGEHVLMRALSGPQPGDRFPIVWVVAVDEWSPAEPGSEARDALPWPLDSVRLATERPGAS